MKIQINIRLNPPLLVFNAPFIVVLLLFSTLSDKNQSQSSSYAPLSIFHIWQRRDYFVNTIWLSWNWVWNHTVVSVHSFIEVDARFVNIYDEDLSHIFTEIKMLFGNSWSSRRLQLKITFLSYHSGTKDVYTLNISRKPCLDPQISRSMLKKSQQLPS